MANKPHLPNHFKPLFTLAYYLNWLFITNQTSISKSSIKKSKSQNRLEEFGNKQF